MKLVKTVTVFSILLLLGLTLAIVASAQEPPDVQLVKIVSSRSELGTAGLSNSPPAGKKVLYMFTGVRHRGTSPKYSTVVHCTNYGTSTVNLTIELFNTLANFTLTTFPPLVVPANRTVTIDTTIGIPENIDAGSGRILGNDNPNTKVICMAQVVALNGSNIPIEVVKLTLYDDQGKCAGSNCITMDDDGGIFLPIILKNSLFF
jgi:hypothetical protein